MSSAEGGADDESIIGTLDTPDAHGDGDWNGLRSTPTTRIQPSLHGLLPCPFRKRNPEHFNIRDYPTCRKPFKTLSRLKSHIQRVHKPLSLASYSPQRGGEPIGPEGSITPMTAVQLSARGGDTRVNTWTSLWEVLFPEDTQIPAAVYEPCVPMDPVEVDKIFEKTLYRLSEDTLQKPAAGVLTKLGLGAGLAPTGVSVIFTMADADLRKLYTSSLLEFQTTTFQQSTSTSAKIVPGHSRSAKPASGRTQQPAQDYNVPPGPPQGPRKKVRGQQTQRQQAVLPLPSNLAGSNTSNGVFSPSSVAYPSPSTSVHFRYPPYSSIGPHVPEPATGIRDQRWNTVTGQAHTALGTAHSFVPLELGASFHSDWAVADATQQVSAFDIHHGQSQGALTGNFGISQIGPAETFTLRQGHVHSGSPVSAPPPEHHGSALYGPHTRGHYTQANFNAWPGMSGDDVDQEEE